MSSATELTAQSLPVSDLIALRPFFERLHLDPTTSRQAAFLTLTRMHLLDSAQTDYASDAVTHARALPLPIAGGELANSVGLAVESFLEEYGPSLYPRAARLRTHLVDTDVSVRNRLPGPRWYIECVQRDGKVLVHDLDEVWYELRCRMMEYFMHMVALDFGLEADFQDTADARRRILSNVVRPVDTGKT